MSGQPRKFSWEKNRERALALLREYEAGRRPKDLAAEHNIDSAQFWGRIQYGRKVRAQREASA